MALTTVRTTEIRRLPDHAEHGFMPKCRTISAAAAGLWVATQNPARMILLLKNIIYGYIAWNVRYKDKPFEPPPLWKRGGVEKEARGFDFIFFCR